MKIYIFFQMNQVYILRALVEAVEDKDKLTWWWGALLVLGMLSMNILSTLSLHMLIASSQKIGMRIRSIVSMVVFKKVGFMYYIL